MELPTQLPDFGPSHPPCLICHGKASGIYYGVNSCEACKGFFARCFTRKTEIKCKFKGSCPAEKKQCASCRYKRCLSLGMSKQASNKGRASSAHRTKVIEEVKRLELQGKMNKDGSLVQKSDYENNMDEIVKLLTNAKLISVPNTAEVFEANLIKEEEYLRQQSVKEEIFGYKGSISRTEYQEVYKQTGLDVDGRKELFEKLLPSITRSVDHFIQFASHIPGFNKIPQRDKLKLIRNSIVDVNVFYIGQAFNLDCGILVYPYDTSVVVRVEDLLGYYENTEGITEWFTQTYTMMQDLELTDEEVAMAAALCVMVADAELCKFSRNVISAGADYVAEILYKEVQKNHDPESHTYAKLVGILTNMRDNRQGQDEFFNNYIMDNLDVGIPNNLLMLFNTESQSETSNTNSDSTYGCK